MSEEPASFTIINVDGRDVCQGCGAPVTRVLGFPTIAHIAPCPEVNRVLGAPGPVTVPRKWVLVKGWHDSGTIDAVYGPYTERHARWLLAGMLEYSSNNWTLVELQAGPSASVAVPESGSAT